MSPDKLRLTQSRFLLVPGAPTSTATNNTNSNNNTPTTWVTPLHMRTSNGSADTLITLEGASLVLDVDPKTEWVLLNAGQRGFVRVNYQTPDLRKALLAAYPKLAEVDRLGVLDDHIALVKVTHIRSATQAPVFVQFAQFRF